jgi:hypothetical protein
MAPQGSISAPRTTEDPRYSVVGVFAKASDHLANSSPVKCFNAVRRTKEAKQPNEDGGYGDGLWADGADQAENHSFE